MDKRLGNKVAVVTGGSAGIGLGVAKRFAAEGAQVFITGRRQSELDKAVAAIGTMVTAIGGDASKLSDIDRIYKTVKEQAGRIDVLLSDSGPCIGTLAQHDKRGSPVSRFVTWQLTIR